MDQAQRHMERDEAKDPENQYSQTDVKKHPDLRRRECSTQTADVRQRKEKGEGRSLPPVEEVKW
jgi:hypothetical protein